MISGIKIHDVELGTGSVAERGRLVSIRWNGMLNRGDSFGEGESSFVAGGREVISGLSRGVIGMRVGGVRQLRISPHLGYQEQAVPGIPPNSVLVFHVVLLKVSEGV